MVLNNYQKTKAWLRRISDIAVMIGFIILLETATEGGLITNILVASVFFAFYKLLMGWSEYKRVVNLLVDYIEVLQLQKKNPKTKKAKVKKNE